MKWTDNMREILYKTLVEAFGPHAEWGFHNYPNNDKDRYEEIVRLLALLFTQITGQEITDGAVKSQIAWAVTAQEKVDGPGKCWFANKRSAMNAGFIDYDYTLKSFGPIQVF